MFYSDDHEPVHVQYNHGFKKHELSLIESILEENTDVILDRWQEFFKQR